MNKSGRVKVIAPLRLFDTGFIAIHSYIQESRLFLCGRGCVSYVILSVNDETYLYFPTLLHNRHPALIPCKQKQVEERRQIEKEGCRHKERNERHYSISMNRFKMRSEKKKLWKNSTYIFTKEQIDKKKS